MSTQRIAFLAAYTLTRADGSEIQYRAGNAFVLDPEDARGALEGGFAIEADEVDHPAHVDDQVEPESTDRAAAEPEPEPVQEPAAEQPPAEQPPVE